MAQNSTWFQATNSVLNLAQLPLIVNAAAFDAGQLSKYQNAAKFKIDFAHRHLTLKMCTEFTNRKFLLPIQSGVTDYPLDTGISGESLKYHSWYNITAGSPYAQHLNFMKYEDYTDQYPDQTVLQSGPPEFMVQLPHDATLDVNTITPMVRVFPIPDASYTLQYQARLNFYPLTSSGSFIMWPPPYEHGLWMWAFEYLEVDLAEGREGMLGQLADEVISQIRVMSQNAEEVRKGVRLPRLTRRYRYRGTYFG